MTDDAARGGISAADFQTDAEHRLRGAVTVEPCRAICAALNRDGSPCRARPLTGTRLVGAHTPGLAAVYGRRSGVACLASRNRRRLRHESRR